MESQSFSVKRAQVEFHNFASLGEPERAFSVYAEENERRGALIQKHIGFIGEMTPFLEIGANAGHSSYMMANQFGADGFALDISADSLRHGIALQDRWGLPRAPIRLAGDAAKLPFADGSLRFVLAFQLLSQFMDIESLMVEVKRVLAPGGIFLFGEEPLKRLLSLRFYRCPYYETMKPWERKLADWGLLGYLVRDVIGAHQEESFGIRQNHSLGLHDWHRLVQKHFAGHRYEIFVPERGWGERIVKYGARRLDPYRSFWRAGRLLGGTLAGFCRKEGEAAPVAFDISHFETCLRCPDCGSSFRRDAAETLTCASCGYRAALEGGVYNLLPAQDRDELYPGDREDIIDLSQPGCERRLLEGWTEIEGVFGNKYCWIGERATARLGRVNPVPQRLRIRGHASEESFRKGERVEVKVTVNGGSATSWTLDRPGLFLLETDVEDYPEYLLEIKASPTWTVPSDDRIFTVNLSMIRLIPREVVVGE